MATHRTLIGQSGEAAVACYLINQGFTICARNYRRPYGEVDIIARKKQLLIFVEVKLRRTYFDDFAAVILPSKQRKIIAVAKEYLAQHNEHDVVCRFDVALVELAHKTPEIAYIENAFDGQ